MCATEQERPLPGVSTCKEEKEYHLNLSGEGRKTNHPVEAIWL
jgi:hypothetical protein